MTWALETAAVTSAVSALAGLGVPALIARIPEPVAAAPEPVGAASSPAPVPASAPAAVPASAPPSGPRREAAGEGDRPLMATTPKRPYAEIAAAPGLAWRSAVAAGIAGGLLGLAVGWRWTLLPLLVLVPVGVALAVVDWRTKLLPTKVIAPTYVVVGLLAVLAAGLAGDWPSLVRALWGLVLARGAFWLLWLVYPRGMGFGDVRLAGVLGLALGLVGWGELTVGIYAGFVIGGVCGLVLSMARVVDRGGYPFGPFMLVGALVGVVFGGSLAEVYLGGL